MWFRDFKIGQTAFLRDAEVTYVWCAECCGQGRTGTVGTFGLFKDSAETCDQCHGKGKHWVSTPAVIRWQCCDGGNEINLASQYHPLKTYRPLEEAGHCVMRTPRRQRPGFGFAVGIAPA